MTSYPFLSRFLTFTFTLCYSYFSEAAQLASMNEPHPPTPALAGPPTSASAAAAARHSELLYRDLMSRGPFSGDPLLAHQVSASLESLRCTFHFMI